MNAPTSLRKTLGKPQGLSREQVKRLISAGIHRAATIHGDKALATAAGCCTTTIQNAKAGTTVPEPHILGNLLSIEPTILWEWLDKLGFKVIPTDQQMSPDMKTARDMSHALTLFIQALEDGLRDHRETIALAQLFRPLIPKLSAIVAEADQHRGVDA